MSRRNSVKPWNGDLDRYKDKLMGTLLYRGHDYVQHKEPQVPTKCIELTYRHEHYNTCTAKAKQDLHPEMTYRGVKHTK